MNVKIFKTKKEVNQFLKEEGKSSKEINSQFSNYEDCEKTLKKNLTSQNEIIFSIFYDYDNEKFTKALDTHNEKIVQNLEILKEEQKLNFVQRNVGSGNFIKCRDCTSLLNSKYNNRFKTGICPVCGPRRHSFGLDEKEIEKFETEYFTFNLFIEKKLYPARYDNQLRIVINSFKKLLIIKKENFKVKKYMVIM